jgi:hypothetical protein
LLLQAVAVAVLATALLVPQVAAAVQVVIEPLLAHQAVAVQPKLLLTLHLVATQLLLAQVARA